MKYMLVGNTQLFFLFFLLSLYYKIVEKDLIEFIEIFLYRYFYSLFGWLLILF